MKKINDSVFYLGIFDKERKIFDQLAPLKEGTTYNSYLVKGAEKNALIDTMYAPFAAEYLAEIKAAGAKIDYIVANHAEQDHSSLIPALLEIFPEAQVFCSAKCAENLQNMLGVKPEKIRAVADKEEVNLGGKPCAFTWRRLSTGPTQCSHILSRTTCSLPAISSAPTTRPSSCSPTTLPLWSSPQKAITPKS
ncbi:MAG: MBL fold metallo-hydrolase [Opitutales bacterium]|nr:MBL fold metallo-hydrolase [Opitutales bacterium]